MANKVGPASEKEPSSSAPLDLLKTYVKSKFCYHPSVLTDAKVINKQQDRFAYQIDLWTLMECRDVKRMDQPYSGENIGKEINRNEWDFDFQRPETIIKKTQKGTHNLEQTRWTTICAKCSGFKQYMCSSCKGDGGKPCHYCKVKTFVNNDLSEKKPCSHCNDTGDIFCKSCKSTGMVDCTRCKGHGKMLHWYQLTIKWYTIHSVSYQSNTSLPDKIIHKTPGKKAHWSTDQKWTKTDSFDKLLQTAFPNQNTNSSMKLDKLIEDFNQKHMKKTKKNCRIVQLKCEIQKLDITEVEYEAEGFKNKENKDMGDKFKFYYYGKGKNDQPLIYENDYPLNTCGCFGAGCSHRSVCCSIS